MLIIRRILSVLKYHYESAGSDARTADLPLIKNHAGIFVLIGFYVLLVRVLGPAFMAKRKAYNITSIMQCYNVVQILLNIYIFVGLTSNFILHPQHSWSCTNLDRSDRSPKTMKLRIYTYLYFINKIMDLLDTVFFVLRKKFKHISFLHVYHHGGMVYATFVFMSVAFGTQFTFPLWINSFVHVLMYIYYFLAARNTQINLEAWKPRMTQIQIFQFGIVAIAIVIPLVNNWCGMSLFWLWFIFLQNIYLTLLFLHFYRKAYIVKKRKLQGNTSKSMTETK